MFQHITLQQMMVELLRLKLQQQHEGKKLELGTIRKFATQEMEALKHQL
jgi:hypothetical protein